MRGRPCEEFPLPAHVCHRAVEARDARFDGVFFVAITSTGIYCRPVCPSRPANPRNRRFFGSAAAAERDGYRPCYRCRPELAPGRALVDSVARLASAAVERIAAGALNARPVRSLARDLHVGERHLRRALQREVGASPVELALTYRLLMAKRLLADTSLDMSRVAFASGFQSLRRFNAAVRERYGVAPSALRRASARSAEAGGSANGKGTGCDPFVLTLAYRPPLDWDAVLAFLDRNGTRGMEIVVGQRYGRTVRVGEASGVVFAEDVTARHEIDIEISESLVSVLMPLLAKLRRLFDLDAEPTIIDTHLRDAGLNDSVAARQGVRVPGAIDGFEAALLALLHDTPGGAALAARVIRELGDPIETDTPGLDRISPAPARVVEAGEKRLRALGVPRGRADAIVSIARSLVDGSLRLDPDDNVAGTLRLLTETHGLDEQAASAIVMRALYWPDAFPANDPAILRQARATTADELRQCAEAWRPWRAYAAMYLWMHAVDSTAGSDATRRQPIVTSSAPELAVVYGGPDAQPEQRRPAW
jgi:AraC family transcriptional regulator of adaptative response / DNA-3-methyladenine glycosylase II